MRRPLLILRGAPCSVLWRNVLWLSSVLWLSGCGSPSPELARCLHEHQGEAPRVSRLPVCVQTTRGAMSVEDRYIPGVVDCELAWFTKAPAALEAQAVVARTYLARFLERKGETAEVPVGAHFQCWRATTRARSLDAAAYTTDLVLLYGEEVVNGNYVSGTKALKKDCSAKSPKASGYGQTSWAKMRRRYLEARRNGWSRPFSGVNWTEVVVTRNEGRRGDEVVGTSMATAGPRNRGALGQYATACLAARGYDATSILRYFYGDDVDLSLQHGEMELDPELLERLMLDDSPES